MKKKILMTSMLISVVVIVSFIIFYKKNYLVHQAKDGYIVFSTALDKKFCFRNCYKGIMNSDGEIIVQALYNQIHIENNVFILYKENEIIIVNQLEPEKVLYQVGTGFIWRYNQNIIIDLSKGNDLIIDQDGNVYKVDQPNYRFDSYEFDYMHKDGHILFKDQNSNKYGFVNLTGKTVIEPIYDEVSIFKSNGYARIKMDKKYGMIDLDGNIVIDPIYDIIFFTEKLPYLLVVKDGKYGYIDYHNQIVIEIKYDNLKFFDNELAIGMFNQKSGAINKQGEVVIDFIYDTIYNSYGDDYFLVSKIDQLGFDKYGVVKSDGHVLIEPSYDGMACYNFKKGVAVVKNGTKMGVIDQEGNIVIDFIYDYYYYYDLTNLCDDFLFDSLIAVEKDGLKGLINYEGDIIVDFKYKNIKKAGDLIAVEDHIDSKWELLDQEGNKVSENKYDSISTTGRIVWKNKKVGIIDEQGKELTRIEYDLMGYFNGIVYLVKSNGKWGLIGLDGKIVVDIEYDMIHMSNENEFVLNKDGKIYLADNTGHIKRIK